MSLALTGFGLCSPDFQYGVQKRGLNGSAGRHGRMGTDKRELGCHFSRRQGVAREHSGPAIVFASCFGASLLASNPNRPWPSRTCLLPSGIWSCNTRGPRRGAGGPPVGRAQCTDAPRTQGGHSPSPESKPADVYVGWKQSKQMQTPRFASPLGSTARSRSTVTQRQGRVGQWRACTGRIVHVPAQVPAEGEAPSD